jgi:hypothetical protein
MSDINDLRYDYLNRKRYIVHDEHFPPLSPETLKEVSHYEAIEYYSREKILQLSKSGLLQAELKKHIDDLPRLRAKFPKGSNEECICMDFITELISKLDLEDFRKLRIERLVE